MNKHVLDNDRGWPRLLSPNSAKARFFLVGLVLLAAAFLAFLYWRSRQNELPPDIENGLAQTLRAEQLKALNQDTDGDGLKDWEEIIFRTDPRNHDTDGDSTPDGEEVRQSRDPKKPAPDDTLSAATPQEAAQDPDSKNLTRDFTVRFLREPVAQLIAGAKPDFNAGAVDDYTRRLLAKPVLADAPRFSQSDIRTAKDKSAEAAGRYFESFGAIFQTLNRRGKNEIEVVAEVFNTQDYGALETLISYPTNYQKAIDELKELIVPQALAEFHLSTLNYLSKFKRSAELIQRAESDPLLATLAINERLGLEKEFKNLLAKSQAELVASIETAAKKLKR